MSDPFQVNPSATEQQPSSDMGQVAPTPYEQGPQSAPEPQPQQPSGQPAGTGEQGASEGQPPSQPSVDYRVQYEQEREQRLHREQEANQYKQVVGQIQRAAEEQQQNNAYNQQVQMMLATAENMPTADANQYVRNQVTNMIAQQRMQTQQALQQRDQEYSQMTRVIAAPQYADHLIESMGLPVDAKQELLNLGDPDLMYRQAPVIKQRYDQWNQQKQTWEQGQQQLARSQEVNTLRQNGLATIGGQGGGGSYTIKTSDDPDERAMQVLHHLRERERQGT